MAKETTNSALMDALRFVSLAQRDVKQTGRDYCQISSNMITARGDILSAGIKVDEDLNCNPHTDNLISALNKCGKTLSITQLDASKLAVKSGKFSCFVPCVAEEVEARRPDAAQIELPASILAGFKAVAHLAQENANTVIESSILLKSGSMVATNSVVGIEYWHGVNLPQLVIPKSFVSAVSSVKFTPTHMGWSETTVTVWFGPDCWLKTQLYAEAWPDIGSVFEAPPIEFKPVPAKLFEAVRAVEDFCDDGKEKGRVYLSEKALSSHKDPERGASYEMKGLHKGCFAVKHLKAIEKVCAHIGFTEDRVYFYGDKVRGVIAGMQD